LAMKNQTNQSNLSQTLPTNHEDLLKEIETNQKVAGFADHFLYYMDTLHRKIITLTNPEQKKVCTKRASDSSRYTEKGIERIRKKIRERLSQYPATFGTMLTLTVAEIRADQKHYKGIEQLEAWEKINKLGRAFTDKLNKWRKRHNLPIVKRSMKVLEIQTARNYPHLHILYTGLSWLAPIDVIQKLWPWGNADIQHTDSTSPVDYVTKYISKVDGKDFMNLMLYAFHLRLFSNSRGLRYSPAIRKNNGWGFFTAGSRHSIETYVNQFIKAGYSPAGELLMDPRGP
jgi:hypothetical protein